MLNTLVAHAIELAPQLPLPNPTPAAPAQVTAGVSKIMGLVKWGSLIAAVVDQHPEYQPLLSDDQQLDRDYSPDSGQTNPFLHLGLHIALQEQLNADRPAGIRTIYQQLCRQHGAVHPAEHQILEQLGATLWEAGRSGQAPDENQYLEQLRRLLRQ